MIGIEGELQAQPFHVERPIRRLGTTAVGDQGRRIGPGERGVQEENRSDHAAGDSPHDRSRRWRVRLSGAIDSVPMTPTSYCPRCLHAFAGAPQECPNLGCRIRRPSSGWGQVLAPGDLLDRTYLVLELLAVGGAGMTYRCQEVDGTSKPHEPDLAIKVLHMRRDSGQYLRRLATEAQILQELDHTAIVECRGFVQRTGHAPYLVTRYEAGGTLTGWMADVGIVPPRTVAR